MDQNEFENRNNSSNPSILRLEYRDYYIYIINFYIGCDCNYLGCENYRKLNQDLKIRIKQTEKIVLTKEGKEKLKLDKNKKYSVSEVIVLAEENYNL